MKGIIIVNYYNFSCLNIDLFNIHCTNKKPWIGGGGYFSPSLQGIFSFQAWKLGFSVKQSTTLEYGLFFDSSKRLRSIPQKLSQHSRSQNLRPNVENPDSVRMLISRNLNLAYDNWQAILGIGWENLDWCS